jgi:hypothetical protein
LIVPKRLSKNALYSIPFDCETDVFFGNHEADSAGCAIGWEGEKQNIRAGNFVASLLEYRLDVRSAQ